MAAGLVEDLNKAHGSEEVSTSQFIRAVILAEIEYDHFFACASRNALSLAVFSSRAVFCKAIVIAAASPSLWRDLLCFYAATAVFAVVS